MSTKPQMDVLRSYQELEAWPGDPVALAVGFFDGVHRGHRYLLKQHISAARQRGLRSLALTFSNAPRGFHHPDREWLYLSSAHEKLWLLSELGLDGTLLLEYDEAIASQTATMFLSGIAACVELKLLTAGYDSSIGCDMVSGRVGYTQLCTGLGLELFFADELEDSAGPVKSSVARELVFYGKLREVRKILGRTYCVIGKVVPGKGKGGTKMGIATANLVLPKEKITPPTGVYACVAEVNGDRYPAATCVMTKAQANTTVLERGQRIVVRGPEAEEIIIEAHLLGYAGNLYGETLRLRFCQHLRGWLEFETIEALVAQIEMDIADTQLALAEEPLLREREHADD